MDGRRALVYSRIRVNRLDYSETDVARQRQQQVLAATADKIASVGGFGRMPSSATTSSSRSPPTSRPGAEPARLGLVPGRQGQGAPLPPRRRPGEELGRQVGDPRLRGQRLDDRDVHGPRPPCRRRRAPTPGCTVGVLQNGEGYRCETPRVARKTVTVLFADVTGSTQLGERLDPEVLRRVMTRYFETSRTVLERHGATVEKFIGDAVMAVFGARRARGRRPGRLARRSSCGARCRTRHRAAHRCQHRRGRRRGGRDARHRRCRQRRRPARAGSRAGRDPARRRDVPRGARLRARRRSGPGRGEGQERAARGAGLLEVLDDAPAFTRRIDSPFVGRGASSHS